MSENIDKHIENINRLSNRYNKYGIDTESILKYYTDIIDKEKAYEDMLENHNLSESKGFKSSIKRFNKVSLLYASIEGFDSLIKIDKPDIYIDKLDELKIEFQKIAAKRSIIKLTSVGDNFIFGGGILEENRTNPIDVIMAAMEMKHAVDKINKQIGGIHIWDINIGIHTGPISALPTNNKNTPYTVLGTSVDLASRLGMACTKGDIVISSLTYELVKEFFECSSIGKMPVKYSGSLELYKIDGILQSLISNDEEKMFSPDFLVKYGSILFLDIQDIVLDMLEKLLPKNLYYHDVKHTIDVVTNSELIGWAEGLNEEEILTLKTAALFHDSGHIKDYDTHEEEGCKIAREILITYNFPEYFIQNVCELIMATKYPPKPKNLMEKVICDSDLDYLGRADFIPVSDRLYMELKSRNSINSYDAWNKIQFKFIEGHHYFTETAHTLRQVNKNKQLERIKKLIESN